MHVNFAIFGRPGHFLGLPMYKLVIHGVTISSGFFSLHCSNDDDGVEPSQSLVPRPHFCSLGCVQYNTWGRPGNAYHMTWM